MSTDVVAMPNRQKALRILQEMSQIAAPKPMTPADVIAESARSAIVAAVQASVGYGSEIDAQATTEHTAADGSRTVSTLSFRFRR
jgi:hypothetical protein